jgi:hypothetical protein
LPIIVLRASGEHYSSGGEIRGLIDASPEHVSRLAWKTSAISNRTQTAGPYSCVAQVPLKDISVVLLSRVDSRRTCVDIQKEFAHQTLFGGCVGCIKR